MSLADHTSTVLEPKLFQNVEYLFSACTVNIDRMKEYFMSRILTLLQGKNSPEGQWADVVQCAAVRCGDDGTPPRTPYPCLSVEGLETSG